MDCLPGVPLQDARDQGDAGHTGAMPGDPVRTMQNRIQTGYQQRPVLKQPAPGLMQTMHDLDAGSFCFPGGRSDSFEVIADGEQAA